MPRGINLESLFAAGHVGTSGYFDYVGQDRSNGATIGDKPITEFLRTNGNLPQPSLFTLGSATGLRDMMLYHAANNYQPGHVVEGGSIYAPAGDWGIQLWSSLASFKEGDLVLNNSNPGSPTIEEMSSLVKGNYHGGSFGNGDFVFYEGTWLKQTAATSTDNAVSLAAVPANPDNLKAYLNNEKYSFGEKWAHADGTVMIAREIMKGTFDANKSYAVGDVVNDGSAWVSLTQKHHGKWNSGVSVTVANETIEHKGNIYRFVAGAGNSSSNEPGTHASWNLVGSQNDATNLSSNNVTTAVNTAGGQNATSTYFAKSPWQRYDGARTNVIGSPTGWTSGAGTSTFARTNEFTNLDNSSKWVKTHYSHLSGTTIGTSYTRGDNIFYQGKHYIYTSHLDSNDRFM